MWEASVYADEPGRWSEVISRDREFDGELTARVIRRGVILPLRSAGNSAQSWQGGVIDDEGNFVTGHTYHPGRRHRRNVISGYAPRAVANVRGTVIYAGGIRPDQFGHFLTESLSRLWWFLENRSPDVRIAFSRTLEVTSAHRNFALLDHLGITPDQILIIDKPTRFETVIVPDQAFFLGNGSYHRVHARAIFNTIRDSVGPGNVEKVYLTRSQLTTKTAETRELNEQMLEDFYRSQGYKVVAPEKLTLAEQISLLAGAKELASTAGTLSHLVLFCQDGISQTVILRHKRSLALNGQWGLSQLRDARTSVVHCTVDMLPGSHTAGVVYFTRTKYWVQYVHEHFDVVLSISMPEEYIADYARNWAELITETPARFLGRYPEWTVADFATSFFEAFTGNPVDEPARLRLTSRFVDHAPVARGRAPRVSVTFNCNGGSAVPSQGLVSGERAAVPTEPTRDGHVFVGWFNSPRLREEFDFSNVITRDKTLHAKWRRAWRRPR